MGDRIWKEALKTHKIDRTSSPRPYEAVAQLKMPTIGSGKGIIQFNVQTYAEFAWKVERRNPDVTFDKSLIDGAFRYAGSLTNAVNSKHGVEYEAMMKRVWSSFVWFCKTAPANTN